MRGDDLQPELSVTVPGEAVHRTWNEYVLRHPEGTADHLWEWSRVITRAFGHQCAYVVARRGHAITGVLPLVLFG